MEAGDTMNTCSYWKAALSVWRCFGNKNMQEDSLGIYQPFPPFHRNRTALHYAAGNPCHRQVNHVGQPLGLSNKDLCTSVFPPSAFTLVVKQMRLLMAYVLLYWPPTLPFIQCPQRPSALVSDRFKRLGWSRTKLIMSLPPWSGKLLVSWLPKPNKQEYPSQIKLAMLREEKRNYLHTISFELTLNVQSPKICNTA